MEFDLSVIADKIQKNEFAKNFINELEKAVKNDNNTDDIKLTSEEELEFEKRQFNFLQQYFENELDDMYIVTNKYKNDNNFHRYKVAKYKDNLECKYIALKEELPKDIKIRDVVRKIDGRYIKDEQATEYIKQSLSKIKQEIIDKRI